MISEFNNTKLDRKIFKYSDGPANNCHKEEIKLLTYMRKEEVRTPSNAHGVYLSCPNPQMGYAAGEI